MDTETKNYEIAYLISPNIKEEDVFGEAGKITGFIQDAKGFIEHIEEPKKIRLAYSIQKTREAYFGWTRFNMDRESLPVLEKRIKGEKAIIRYLLVIAEDFLPTRIPRPKSLYTPKPSEPTSGEEKIDIAELDKRLEEILGK